MALAARLPSNVPIDCTVARDLSGHMLSGAPALGSFSVWFPSKASIGCTAVGDRAAGRGRERIPAPRHVPRAVRRIPPMAGAESEGDVQSPGQRITIDIPYSYTVSFLEVEQPLLLFVIHSFSLVVT